MDQFIGDADALLIYNLLRTLNALSPFIDRGLRELHLTGAQLNALMVLRDAGQEGITLTDLGRRLVVTKANVTGLVDRLERDGLVLRDSHADRRITIARLTPDGEATLTAALPRHREILTELLGELSADEKTQLIGLLTRLRRAIRERSGDAPAGVDTTIEEQGT
jgi:MarR family 2-MHQ and catechol resistance regulon transcriptional repressor